MHDLASLENALRESAIIEKAWPATIVVYEAATRESRFREIDAAEGATPEDAIREIRARSVRS